MWVADGTEYLAVSHGNGKGRRLAVRSVPSDAVRWGIIRTTRANI
jgi:hypothetical protein